MTYGGLVDGGPAFARLKPPVGYPAQGDCASDQEQSLASGQGQVQFPVRVA